MTEIMPFPKTIYCFIGPPLKGAFFNAKCKAHNAELFCSGANLCVRSFLTEQGLRYLCHTCGVTAPLTQTGRLGGYPSSVFFGKAEKYTFPSGKACPPGKFFSFLCAPFKFRNGCFYFMFNGFPFNLHKNRRDGNRDICEHKKRKSESIKNLFHRGSMDLFPFGNGCYRADSEKGEIHIENAFQK